MRLKYISYGNYSARQPWDCGTVTPYVPWDENRMQDFIPGKRHDLPRQKMQLYEYYCAMSQYDTAYDPDYFQNTLHKLLPLLDNYLRNSRAARDKVLQQKSIAEILSNLDFKRVIRQGDAETVFQPRCPGRKRHGGTH